MGLFSSSPLLQILLQLHMNHLVNPVRTHLAPSPSPFLVITKFAISAVGDGLHVCQRVLTRSVSNPYGTNSALSRNTTERAHCTS